MQHGPRNGNSLFLTSGKRNAVFPHLGLEPVRQIPDELVRIGHFRRIDNFFK